MAVSTWVSAIGHFFSDVLGGAVGAMWAEGGLSRSAAAKTAGGKLTEAVVANLMPDREDIMKALIFHLGEGNENAILGLLIEAQEQHCILMAGHAPYPENWIINMLIKIEERDRKWVFEILNEVCKRDRKRFFALLEILHNDGVFQWFHILHRVAAEHIDMAAINARLSQATTRIHNSEWRQRLRKRAHRQGMFQCLRARLRR